MNLPSYEHHVRRDHYSVDRNARYVFDLWEFIPWSMKKEGQYQAGTRLDGRSGTQCKVAQQTFVSILPRPPVLIIFYKGKQEAEAYLRVSPKREIKMTVTHPWKTISFFLNPGFTKMHFMDDLIIFVYLTVTIQNTIFIKTEAAERKHTNCHLLALLQLKWQITIVITKDNKWRPTCDLNSKVLFPAHWSDSKGPEWIGHKTGSLCLCKGV